MRVHMRMPSLLTDERGVAIPLFALMALVLVMLSLAGLDFMRFHIVHSRVQAAVDAAVLAAGRRLDSQTIETDAETFFWANMSPAFMHASIDGPTVTTQGTALTGQTVTLSVEVKVPLLVAGFIESTSWDFQVRTVARRQTTNVELVLAMDNTGSMEDFGKLQAMQQAARTLITTLIGDPSATSRAGVAFGTVPFTTVVRTPGRENWLEPVPADTMTLQHNRDGSVTMVPDRYNRWASYPVADQRFNLSRDWRGCILENPDRLVTDLDDSPSGGTLPIYLTEVAEVCTDQRWGECTRTAWRTIFDDSYCTIQPVSFLDPDSTRAIASINSMRAYGGTAVFTGLLWGWRMLSPDWDATHDWGDPLLPRPVSPSLTKAVVLLTDGANSDNLADNDPERGGYPSALGRGPSQATLNNALRTVCTSAKAAGITIYTITFGNEVNTGGIRELMRNCATDEAHFFDAPSNAALETAFTSIGGSLSRLSLIE